MSEFYLAISFGLFVWCYLIDRDFPGELTYFHTLLAIAYVVFGWPLLLKIIAKETMERFQ